MGWLKHCTARRWTTQHSTAQCCTALYCTPSHSPGLLHSTHQKHTQSDRQARGPRDQTPVYFPIDHHHHHHKHPSPSRNHSFVYYGNPLAHALSRLTTSGKASPPHIAFASAWVLRHLPAFSLGQGRARMQGHGPSRSRFGRGPMGVAPQYAPAIWAIDGAISRDLTWTEEPMLPLVSSPASASSGLLAP